MKKMLSVLFAVLLLVGCLQAAMATDAKASNLPVGSKSVTFYSYDGSSLGVYTTDEEGYLFEAPTVAMPDGWVFVAWENLSALDGSYMLTTEQSDSQRVADYINDGFFVFSSLYSYQFTQDTELLLTPAESGEGSGISVTAIQDIDNRYVLTIPFILNGKQCSVRLNAELIASATANYFSNSPSLCSVEVTAGDISATISKITVSGKDSITYTISIDDGAGKIFSFTAKVNDNPNKGGPNYAVSFPASDHRFSTSANTISAKFDPALTPENEPYFIATVPSNRLHATELINFNFSVNWNDNRYNARPTGAAVFTLYSDNVRVNNPALVVTESTYNVTSYVITGLPRYNTQGNEIHYTLNETLSSAEYIVIHDGNRANTFIENNGNISNNITAPISIVKTWRDGLNANNTRPSEKTWTESLTFYRLTNGVSNSTFTYLPSYDASTNVLSLHCEENGDTVTATIEYVNNNWLLTTQRLECYDDSGNPYVYYFREDASSWCTIEESGDAYVQSFRNNTPNPNNHIYSGDTSISLLTNTEDYTITKVWDDNNASDAARPTMTFYLYRYPIRSDAKPFTNSPVSGHDNMVIVPTHSYSFVEKSEDNQTWTLALAQDLPKYDDEGFEYVYFTLEDLTGTNASAYTKTVDNSTSVWQGAITSDKYILADGTVINGLYERITPSVTKTWRASNLMLPGESREISATFVLEMLEDGEWVQVGDPLTLSGFTVEQKTLMGTFPAVNMYDDNRQEIAYRIREVSASFDGEDNTADILYDASFSYVPGMTSKTGDQVLVDTAYEGVFTSAGFDFITTYEIQGDRLLVSNVLDNRTKFGIHKNWEPSLFPPDWQGGDSAYITVQLMQNGEVLNLNSIEEGLHVDSTNAYVTDYTVNADGTLTIHTNGDFDFALLNLPRYDESGLAYRYTAVELDCSHPYVYNRTNYTTRPSYTVSEGHTYQDIPVINLYNTHIGDGIGMVLATEKIFKDSIASSLVSQVTVGVFHKDENGEYTLVEGTESILNEANYWYAEIVFRPVNDDINYNNYFIRELSIDGAFVDYSNTPNWLADAVSRPTPSFINGDGYCASNETDGYYWQITTEKNTNAPITTYRITNLWLGYVNIEVSKNWKIGATNLTGRFVVLANGVPQFEFSVGMDGKAANITENMPPYIEATNVNKADSWSVYLMNFPKYDDNGFIISYGVEETGIIANETLVPFSYNVATVYGKRIVSSVFSDYLYGADHHSDDWMRATFTNTYIDNGSLEVYKVWRDGYAIDNVRPDIVMNLMRKTTDPAKASAPAQLIESDCKWNTKLNKWLWKCTFDDRSFAMYDENGYDYIYYVEEEILSATHIYKNAYYTLLPFDEATGAAGTRTEIILPNHTADANGPYAVARFTKYHDAPDSQVGVVLNYISEKRVVNGSKVWMNLPSWASQAAFGDVTIAVFGYRPTEEPITDAEFVSLVTLTNGTTSFAINNMPVHDEYGYTYDYFIKETVPAENTTDPTREYLRDKGGNLIIANGTCWEICAEDSPSYRGYRVNYYDDNSITNTYTGAPYVSFSATKVWDLSQYLRDYPNAASIEYPALSLTLAVQANGTLSYKEDAAVLNMPGGIITKQGSTWVSDDPSVIVTYDPTLLRILVTVSGDQWVSLPNATCNAVLDSSNHKVFPTYGPNGERYTYFIKEAAVNGYLLTGSTLNGHPVSVSANGIRIDSQVINAGEDTEVAISYTNEFKLTPSELRATKIWDDVSNRYGTRPNPADLKLNLYQNDTLIYSQTHNPYALVCDVIPNTDNTWTYSFKTTLDTPSSFRFPGVGTIGNVYTYRVEEVFENAASAKAYGAVQSIAFAGSNNTPSPTNPTITNRLVTTGLKVDKEWIDQEGKSLTIRQMHQLNELGYMPSAVTFQIFYRSGEDTYAPFLDADGAAVTFTATWDMLYEAVTNNLMLTVADNLPRYTAGGAAFEYIAKETSLTFNGRGEIPVIYNDMEGTLNDTEGCFTAVSVHPQNGYTLISNKMKLRTLLFSKYWDDDANRDGYRPTESSQFSITLENNNAVVSSLPVAGEEWVLMQSGVTIGIKSVGKWTYDITVPDGGVYRAYENYTGAWASHYVPAVQAAANGQYYFSNTGDEYVIANYHERDTINIAVTKRWVDENNAWGLRYDLPIALTQNNNSNVSYYYTGIQTHSVTYSTGNVPDGQITSVTNTALTQNSTITLKAENSQNATILFTSLPRFAPKTEETVMAPPTAYTYRVAETYDTAYKTPSCSPASINSRNIANGATGTFAFTNTLDTVNFGSRKVWRDDFDNAFGSRGDVTLVVLLKQNGKYLLHENGAYTPTETPPSSASEITRYVHRTFTATETTTKTFSSLPKKNLNTNVNYVYALEEFFLLGGQLYNSFYGYTGSYSGNTITNTLQQTTTLSVDKTWVENATTRFTYQGLSIRPNTLVFDIYYRHVPNGTCADDATQWQKSTVLGYAHIEDSDDVETSYVLQSTAAGGSALHLPVMTVDGGCMIEYKAVEHEVDSYTTEPDATAEFTGNATDGFAVSITNKQKVTSLTAKKVWMGEFSDQFSNEVTVRVRYNLGAGYKDLLDINGDPVLIVLNDDNGWTATLDNLLYETSDGTVIQYIVEETAVTSIFTASYSRVDAIDGDAEKNGYTATITNAINKLSFTKTAIGGDPDTTFSFRVDVTGDADKTYSYTVTDTTDSITYGTVTNGNAVAIKAGQTVTLYGIGLNKAVTITEIGAAKADGSLIPLTEAYTTTVNGSAGTEWATPNLTANSVEISFVNTYQADGTLALTAKKHYDGPELLAGQFEFTLYSQQGAPIETVTNDANGNIAFTPFTYSLSTFDADTHEKTFIYTVRETGTEPEDITFDTRVYTVTITVKDNMDGTILATAAFTYIDEEGELVTVPAMTFTNHYIPDEPDPELPPTGDTGHPALWIGLVCAAGAAFFALVTKKRTKRSKFGN